MRVTVITPPEAIVTVDEVKQWTRIDADDDDALLEELVRSATQFLDAPMGWVGRAFGVQTLQMTLDASDWRKRVLPLWYPPIREIVSVHYFDADGLEQELSGAEWRLMGNSVCPAPDVCWPGVETRPDAARVVYEAGYEEVPSPLRSAIMLLVAQWYRMREAASDVAMSEPPFAVSALVSPFRIIRL